MFGGNSFLRRDDEHVRRAKRLKSLIRAHDQFQNLDNGIQGNQGPEVITVPDSDMEEDNKSVSASSGNIMVDKSLISPAAKQGRSPSSEPCARSTGATPGSSRCWDFEDSQQDYAMDTLPDTLPLYEDCMDSNTELNFDSQQHDRQPDWIAEPMPTVLENTQALVAPTLAEPSPTVLENTQELVAPTLAEITPAVMENAQ